MLSALGLAGPEQLLVFLTAGLVLNLTPGVDFALTVARTLQAGPRAGAAAALGICLGATGHALLAAAGLAALLAASAAAFLAVKVAGALYLLWLALGMARHAWRGAPATAELPAAAPRRLAQELRTGVLTNLLNPKVALFFLAFVPQFIAAGTPHKTLAFLGLSAVFVAQSLVFLLALVALAAPLRRLPRRPGLARWLNGLGAGLFAALAVRLLGARA